MSWSVEFDPPTATNTMSFSEGAVSLPPVRDVNDREPAVAVVTEPTNSMGIQGQALPAEIVKLVMVTFWPVVMLMLSSVMSPPPPVAVTVPCAWHVVPFEA